MTRFGCMVPFSVTMPVTRLSGVLSKPGSICFGYSKLYVFITYYLCWNLVFHEILGGYFPVSFIFESGLSDDNAEFCLSPHSQFHDLAHSRAVAAGNHRIEVADDAAPVLNGLRDGSCG